MKKYKVKCIHKDILEVDTEKDQIKNNELFKQLTETKELIDTYPKQWDSIKKVNHEYEYIYTSSIPRKNISYIIPVSRSYFKLIEVVKEYNILDTGKKYKIACIAEAPGGFIQSLLHLSDKQSFQKQIYSITLLSKDHKVPYWNNILFKEKDVFLSKGQDNTGDIYNLVNIFHFIKQVGQQSCQLITGDGGFDYSTDYNNQEVSSIQLIYSEILIALHLQKEGGFFVCKLFDLFHTKTIKLIYILSLSYEEIYFYKPDVSRISNSEKYIVCKGYLGYNKKISNLLCHYFMKDDLPIHLPEDFYNEIQKYNTLYIQQQMKIIRHSIQMIESNSRQTQQSLDIQINKAKQWCQTYNIPINPYFRLHSKQHTQSFSRWN